MTAKISHKTKKSKSEADHYRKSVKANLSFHPGTIEVSNNNLRGSNQLTEYDPEDEINLEPKISIWHRTKKWLSQPIQNAFLCAAAALILSFLWNLNSDISVMKYQIDDLKEQIIELETDSTTKEMLSLQLENLKGNLENTFIFKINEVQTKLDLLEQQIEYIKQKCS